LEVRRRKGGRRREEKELPVPIRQEAGWAPEKVWTIWRSEIIGNVYIWLDNKATSCGLSRALAMPKQAVEHNKTYINFS
jgi:hypothetical protein